MSDLENRQSAASSGPSHPKAVNLIKTISRPGTEAFPPQQSEQDACFKPFIFKGSVSLTGNPKEQKPVRILRDTGGFQSFILADVLPLSGDSYCQSNAIVQGIEMGFVPVPLHKIHVHSDLVSGVFQVAVRPTLPVKGVDFIMSYDIAVGKVVPVPEVVENPALDSVSDVFQQCPDVFPACVVTRAQRKKFSVDLSESFLALDHEETFVEKTPTTVSVEPEGVGMQESHGLTLPVDHAQYIAEQQSDVTLAKCLASVLGKEEANAKKAAYYLEDGMLMRAWSNPAAEGMD